jgi:hypothetical protein
VEEAKFSTNIKFKVQGFECQFTMREDTGSAAELLDRAFKAVAWLKAHEAVPGNGNGKPFPKPADEPVCPKCGQSDMLELISFEKDGKPRKAWKCQRCKKWLPGNGN